MALSRIQTDGIEDDAITTAKILDGTVGPSDIGDGELTNTQINASAAIAVSKISGLGTAATIDFGTSANQIVQLDGSGNLPALNASALTNLDAGDLSGNLPAVSGAALTNLTAANLTGALPAISGANLTGVSTDTSAMENNIAILAFKTQSANNLAKFNLIDQVVDEYYDTTGIDASASTNEVVGGSGIAKYYDGVSFSATAFAYTGSNQTWTAPSGVTSVTIKLWGAGGSGGSSASTSVYGRGGASGGFISATVTVVPSTVYSILVGQSNISVAGATPSPYTNAYGGGGNGGGHSTQRFGGTGGGRTEFSIGGGSNVPAGTRMLVAGGGGGGSAVYNTVHIAASQENGSGGIGGGSTGGSGNGSGTPPTGGTQVAGGAIGAANGGSGTAPAAGVAGIGGGAEASDTSHDTNYGAGGGGGGGFYGGGGGRGSSVSTMGHGGGGGSSYANPSHTASVTNTQGNSATTANYSVGGIAPNSSDSDYVSGVGEGGDGSNQKPSGGTQPASTDGGDGRAVVLVSSVLNLTLQSVANTALTSPTTGDIVMLIENASGTAVLGTNIKVFVSRNGGAAWDEATGSYALADKGTWGSGTKKIITANGIPFTGAAGTDMRYKITTHAQNAGTLETRVHATSLAWA